MPVYDRLCPTCGWAKSDNYETRTQAVTCPDGHDTDRVWIGRPVTLIGDEIPGGQVIENAGHHPVTVYSRSERKRLLEARGLREFVRHVPVKGSDKSPHTTSWSSMSAFSLDEARKLLERVDAK